MELWQLFLQESDLQMEPIFTMFLARQIYPKML